INSDLVFKRSKNFTLNKVSLIEIYIDALEKGVFEYMESNARDYKLVLSQEQVSKITKIEFMNLNWEGKSVTANVKKYVSETIPTKPNQIEVVVTNTDPLSPAPATNEDVLVNPVPTIIETP